MKTTEDLHIRIDTCDEYRTIMLSDCDQNVFLGLHFHGGHASCKLTQGQAAALIQGLQDILARKD
jgi:hypothetical protein